MRILHVLRSADASSGGPTEGVRQLGLLAVESGHEVEVVSLDAPGATFLSSFPLSVHALGPTTSNYGYSPRLVPWLRDNVSNYDVVVINGMWQYQGFGCWRVLRNAKTPYVVFTHGMLDPWFKRRYPIKHLKKWLYWPWGEYRVLRDAAAVMFTCDEERLLARQSFWLYQAKERIVPLGTSAPNSDAEFQKEQFYLHYPETRGKRVFLFMGRIHPKKGCDLAIKAFRSVLDKDQNFHLVFAGPDQVGWKAELSRLAEGLNLTSNITWSGMIQGDLKWGALHAAEALFLPSHQENFGIVVAEALSCGTPVLISNQVNIWREILQDGAGLVQPDDLRGATSLLEAWAELTEADKRLMRAAAVRCFGERFEIKSASGHLISSLSSIVKSSRES